MDIVTPLSAGEPDQLSPSRPHMSNMPAMTADAGPAPVRPKGFFRRISLSKWIIVSMVVGIIIGWMFPDAARAEHGGWSATDLNVLSNIFLRMIKSLIVPL